MFICREKIKIKEKSHKIIGKLHELNKRKAQLQAGKISEAERVKFAKAIKESEEEVCYLYVTCSQDRTVHILYRITIGSYRLADWRCRYIPVFIKIC